MAITYPISLPSAPGPRNVEWSPMAAVSSSSSPFTFQQQVQAHQGQLWVARISLPPMAESLGEPWVAALLSLNGRQGTFLWGDRVRKAPRGTAGGTPLVNGAAQVGQELVTDGWPASVNGVLLMGDLIQIGSGATTRMYKILKNVNSNGSGQATLDIWPRLRESPADNAAIVTSEPKCVWRLKDNIMDWSVNTAKHFGLEIDAVEAI